MLSAVAPPSGRCGVIAFLCSAMRAIAIGWLCLAACGGAMAPAASTQRALHGRQEPDREPVDPLVALTPDDSGQLSWVIPGAIHLELGGPAVGSAGAGRPIEVAAIDQ